MLMPTIGYTVVGLSFASVLVLAVCAQPGSVMGRAATFPLLRTFGKYSYALYIFHLPLFHPITELLTRQSSVSSTRYGLIFLPGLVASIAVALAVAWISWNICEKRFLALKRFFPYLSSSEFSSVATS